MSERTPQTESELVELVRSIDVPAPDSLHRRVESLVADRTTVRRREHRVAGAARFSTPRRLAATGALGAAVTVVLVLVLTGGGSSTPSLQRTVAELTLRPATIPAPPESRGNRAALTTGVENVSFPYWEESFGWRSTGARTDSVDGRPVTTVFYGDERGLRIGYAIVGGTEGPAPSGGVVASRDGTTYRVLSENGTTVVTWLRHGHLCVVSGRDVSRSTLLRLASWGHRAGVA